MANSDVRITILGSNSRGECDAGCGTDWSLPESLALAGERLRERFKRDIPVEYIHMDKSSDSPMVREWDEQIKNKNFSLPLLLLNNRVRISGQFDIRQVLDVVEIEMEVGDF